MAVGRRKSAKAASDESISGVILERYRVFRKRTEIPFGKLTLLAGANSSGKSSAMHPLLLMKQTLDAPFDPGPLLLAGDHVALASFDDARTVGESRAVVLGVTTSEGARYERAINRNKRGDVSLVSQRLHGARSEGSILRAVERILHVPGLRSPPARDYPVTAVGPSFPGRFDRYVASVLWDWQSARAYTAQNMRLRFVEQQLRQLGLTWRVQARKQGDTKVTLKVGRLPKGIRGGANDVVDLSDVGVGVSQVLPVLVALWAAEPGQLVYIEQPELHLHPRAQWELADILVGAAYIGVRLVVETHSSLLLLGIQAIIAAERYRLEPKDVQLHWFSRDPKTGDATVTSRTLDDQGAFSDWPQDFDHVQLEAQAAYLDAAEAKRSARK